MRRLFPALLLAVGCSLAWASAAPTAELPARMLVPSRTIPALPLLAAAAQPAPAADHTRPPAAAQAVPITAPAAASTAVFPIPEPGMLALLVSGAVMLLLSWRQRVRKTGTRGARRRR